MPHPAPALRRCSSLRAGLRWAGCATLFILFGLAISRAAEVSPRPAHILEPVLTAMATNAPGLYPLPKVWTGREKITYSDAAPGVADTNRHHRLDTAQAMGNLRHPFFVNYSWCIGERGTNELKPGTIHAYRPRLPSDAELAAIRTDAALTNLFHAILGLIQVPDFAAGAGFGSQHFTLGTNNTIETLRVYFYKNKPGTNFQSVTIHRATLRREGVWWYP